jgi:hypothetical protein
MTETTQESPSMPPDRKHPKPTSVTMTDGERADAEEYARLTGIGFFTRAVVHEGITAIRAKLPSLRQQAAQLQR